MDQLIVVVLSLMVLLGLASLMLPLASKLRTPYSVLLALFGILVGLLAVASGGLPLPKPAADVLAGVRDLGLTGQVFLYLFLPSLLFAAGLSVNVRRLMDDVVPVLILAVVAVVICTLVVGASLHLIFALPLAVTLLLGAVIATTDPAAVVAIFRDLGAPRRMQILVEGESLFNDAAAIALFTLLLGVVAGHGSGSLAQAAADIVVDFAGGLVLGYIAGRAACTLSRAVNDYPVAETTLTVSLAYTVYIAGDVYLQVSGVVATVTAALVVGSIGRKHLSAEGWTRLQAVWEQIEFLASTLIFVLAATMIPDLLSDLRWSEAAMLAVMVVAALLARAVVLFLLMPTLSAVRLAEGVSTPHKLVLLWGAMRGAVTLAMALSVIENPLVPHEDARLVAVLATGFVLFTLFVNAPTLRPLIRLLHLDRLSVVEAALRDRILAVSGTNVRQSLASLAGEFGIPETAIETTLSSGTEHGPDVKALEAATEVSLDAADALKVGLVTLAAREEELYLEGFGDRTISRRIIGQCTAHAGRLRDAAKTAGLRGYRKAVHKALQPRWSLRIALTLYNRLGITGPLSRLLGDRFEAMLVTRATLHRLHGFTEGSIAPLLGSSLASELLAVLNAREEGIDTAIRAFELQYPGYAQRLRAGYFGRAVLRLEEAEYRQKRNDALISREVYRELIADARRRREAMSGRPVLDLGLELTSMIKQVPLFAALTDKQLQAIGRLLRPRLAVPHECIIRKGERGDAMFFIASGAVEVSDPESGTRVTRRAGGFFGEIAVLHNRPRTAEVRASGYCHLLVLYAGDMRRLLRQHPDMRAEIERVARSRMKRDSGSASKAGG